MSDVIIHTVGKVGTHSFAGTLRKSCPGLAISCCHHLVPETMLQYLKFEKNRATGINDDRLKSVRNQRIRSVDAVQELDSGEGHIFVISCMRNPYHKILYAVFHHANINFNEIFKDCYSIDKKINCSAENGRLFFQLCSSWGTPPKRWMNNDIFFGI